MGVRDMCAECGRKERVYLAVNEEIGAAPCAGATLRKRKMGVGVAEASSGDAKATAATRWTTATSRANPRGFSSLLISRYRLL
ncbi:hypothetical protein MRB53_028519 [Persea americana]|uniref:Uncharacterized protein n=1 Tax=Persea americana TaxID=3435 RepID=A0ACC2KG96_PERAE|nr:hypothetical protein MRB53_028519 [Persea americana]